MPIKWIGEKVGLEFLALAWLSITSLFWLIFNGPAWLPALIFLVFIGMGIRAGLYPYRRTLFDFGLGFSLVMALVGVWVAYDRVAAWDKFWMLLLAISLFYAIASLPKVNAWLLIGLVASLGALISLHFWIFYDWRTLPVDFRIITRLGLAWMTVRPQLQGQTLAPNITAGILAGFFPITLALGMIIWRQRSTSTRSGLSLVIVAFLVSLQALTIFMTSSRGAWFALTIGLVVWIILRLSDKLNVRLTRSWKVVLLGGGIAIVALAGTIILMQIGNPNHILDYVPGLPTGQSRVGIDRLAVRLIRDFPFTGGGLGAFPGLFSQYMLVIPNVLFRYSHNLYLDVALEQGLPGFLALLVVLGGSVSLLMQTPVNRDTQLTSNLLREAALAGLVVMLVHGLIDDAFFGERGTPFIWVFTGIAVFIQPVVTPLVVSATPYLDRTGKPPVLQRRLWSSLRILLPLGFAILLVSSWRGLAAAWLANLGAVRMAQLQLSDFPTNQWRGGGFGDSLEQAQTFFRSAVAFDPTNTTALHRLGLIALQEQDFQTAINYLEAAYRQDMGHRGVLKNLGYAYVWNGQFEAAQTLLERIPEAQREMEVYTWWWMTQKRPDLAQNAQVMVRRLATLNSTSMVALSLRLTIP